MVAYCRGQKEIPDFPTFNAAQSINPQFLTWKGMEIIAKLAGSSGFQSGDSWQRQVRSAVQSGITIGDSAPR